MTRQESFLSSSELAHLSPLDRGKLARKALTAENFRPDLVVQENETILSQLPHMPFRKLGQKLVKGEPLSFEESFIGMTYVVAGSNEGIFRELADDFARAHGYEDEISQSDLVAPGRIFLSTMAQKESLGSLSPDEIAGMAAGAMMDLNTRIKTPYVIETSGMGGDRGFVVDGQKRKVINASTLSAIVVASMDIPVIKHGSYANTSQVGSTNAIEDLGVNILQSSLSEIRSLFEETSFYFSDAYVAKTIHDHSHHPFMRYETINHLVGPMTPPLDKQTTLHKVIGVNEGVHPGLIARSYQVLHERGYQTVGNVAVVSGLDQDFNPNMGFDLHGSIRKHMQLDEISPFYTAVSFAREGRYAGTYLIKPEDFGASLDFDKVLIPDQTYSIMHANRQALNGNDRDSSTYLAMNSALALFTQEYLDKQGALQDKSVNKAYLNECFLRCMESIASGQAAKRLEKIVTLSNSKPSIGFN